MNREQDRKFLMDFAVVHHTSISIQNRLSVFFLSSLESFQHIYNIHNRLMTFPELKSVLKSLFFTFKKYSAIMSKVYNKQK